MHNQSIFESLFNRDFSDTGNTGFLKELTEKHPYFSPAQFFLLEKMQDNAPAFEKQAVKATILFNNPHWLHFQLKETGLAGLVSPEAETTEILPGEAEAAEMENSNEATFKVETAEPGTAEMDDLPDNTDEPAVMEKEIEPMHIELKMPLQNAALEEAMLFEPMHLVDYFASQGIKLSDEVQTADKLGRQLKSFTEWLKIMKKVHVENEAENPVKTDINVQEMAENSNTGTEILTEAMAEVFARQGKLAKAGEVYQKLSLLNPAKSTYFAAKLENLKAL